MSVDPQMLIKKAEPQIKRDYVATHSFADFKLHPIIEKNISNKGYTAPSPIQDQVISTILEGRDVIGLASTGTGKTAAFLLPIIQKIVNDPQQKAIVITPTRELALQIMDEARAFAQGTRCFSTLVIGGVSISRQIRDLRRNPNIVVGTPGRIKDLTERRALYLDQYKTIVLDEVDRMLDMGFIHDISHIISLLPQKRHSLFFSATMTQKAKMVAARFLTNPITVEVASQKASTNVDQDIVRISGQNKVDVLHDLLIKPGFDKVLVFGRTKHGMERLYKQLRDRGFETATIHGNKSQSQRQRALDAFKQNRIRILLATDVASRGIDIDNVSHVINYELPETYDDYIHRIGRTGRADKTGVALTFID
ncbi:DEAD/DEAH box helicase [Candidatus Roizmanbacteria bacterium]|nr:MAG: DEAD/DEAH box helicase [Candidatus Roizmanbacteria bacterium]